MGSTNSRGKPSINAGQAIQGLMVEGFKSIDAEVNIEIRPLTILAGANSAGKSSALQPLLLLKQTLEAPFDPGPLLLNGPNVKFTAATQFTPKCRKDDPSCDLIIGVAFRADYWTRIHFQKTTTNPIELRRVRMSRRGQTVSFEPGEMPLTKSPLKDRVPNFVLGGDFRDAVVLTRRNRCFLDALIQSKDQDGHPLQLSIPLGHELVEDAITRVVHVPGLRGNPRRNYPRTAVGDRFPGTFEEYVASVVAAAQDSRDTPFIEQLGTELRDLGLTWKVQAQSVDDTQVELKVGRLPKPTRGGAHDLVSIADVGFGVSQTLPVVVALLTAKPGQLVYIEQPEIHLHPRAQDAMAGLLARAAERGVQVVIETHSSLLLLGIQRLVAEGTLDPSKVKLHWFKRDENTGVSNITSADLDESGSFGDWPEDFDDTILAAQQRYLDAAEKKLAHGTQKG